MYNLTRALEIWKRWAHSWKHVRGPGSHPVRLQGCDKLDKGCITRGRARAHQLEAVDAAPGIIVGRARGEGPRVRQRRMHHQQLPISRHRHLQHDTPMPSSTFILSSFQTAWLTDICNSLPCTAELCLPDQLGKSIAGRGIAAGLPKTRGIPVENIRGWLWLDLISNCQQ